MGRKKKKPEVKPFCYYCGRSFAQEKVLINHQKARHFKCLKCHKKMSTARALVHHMYQVHKESLKRVAHAKEGRDTVTGNEPSIYGMQGVPAEMIEERKEKLRLLEEAGIEEEAEEAADKDDDEEDEDDAGDDDEHDEDAPPEPKRQKDSGASVTPTPPVPPGYPAPSQQIPSPYPMPPYGTYGMPMSAQPFTGQPGYGYLPVMGRGMMMHPPMPGMPPMVPYGVPPPVVPAALPPASPAAPPTPPAPPPVHVPAPGPPSPPSAKTNSTSDKDKEKRVVFVFKDADLSMEEKRAEAARYQFVPRSVADVSLSIASRLAALKQTKVS